MKKLLKRCLAYLPFFLLAWTANGQINRRTVDNLISSQDTLFFTTYNLDSSKYFFGFRDAYDWHLFKMPLASTDHVFEMQRDHQNKFWIGCSKGLLTYDLHTFSLVAYDTVPHMAFNHATDTLWGISNLTTHKCNVFYYHGGTFHVVPDTAFGDSLFLGLAVDTLGKVYVFGKDSTYSNDTSANDTTWDCLDTILSNIHGWTLRSNPLVAPDNRVVFYARSPSGQGWLADLGATFHLRKKIDDHAIWRHLEMDEDGRVWYLRHGQPYTLSTVAFRYEDTKRVYYEDAAPDELAPKFDWEDGFKFLLINSRRFIIYGKNYSLYK